MQSTDAVTFDTEVKNQNKWLNAVKADFKVATENSSR